MILQVTRETRSTPWKAQKGSLPSPIDIIFHLRPVLWVTLWWFLFGVHPYPYQPTLDCPLDPSTGQLSQFQLVRMTWSLNVTLWIILSVMKWHTKSMSIIIRSDWSTMVIFSVYLKVIIIIAGFLRLSNQSLYLHCQRLILVVKDKRTSLMSHTALQWFLCYRYLLNLCSIMRAKISLWLLIGRGDKLENFDFFSPTSKTWKGLLTTN